MGSTSSGIVGSICSGIRGSISSGIYSNGVLDELVSEVELLQKRDRYRDVEYICGRLSTLKDLYNHQILPLVEKQAYDKDAWRQVFWLIEDREGRIIMLVDNLVWQIKDIIDKFKRGQIPIEELQSSSKRSYDELKSSIEELHQLNNKIMGFSGTYGLMELTDIGDDTKKTIITMKPKNNPWISGSFYLIAAVVILSLLMVAGKIVPLIVFPIALIGGLIVFTVIGILQLRNDDKIPDKSFQNLLKLTFKQIPFIRSSDK